MNVKCISIEQVDNETIEYLQEGFIDILKNQIETGKYEIMIISSKVYNFLSSRNLLYMGSLSEDEKFFNTLPYSIFKNNPNLKYVYKFEGIDVYCDASIEKDFIYFITMDDTFILIEDNPKILEISNE